MLVRSVHILVMRAIFRMRGNESQPGLQLFKKLAMPLVGKNMWERQPGLLVSTSSSVSTQMEGTPPAQPSKNIPRTLATSSHWIVRRGARILLQERLRTPSRFTKDTQPLTGTRATMLCLCYSVSCHMTEVVA